jgi:hypothetical protein
VLNAGIQPAFGTAQAGGLPAMALYTVRTLFGNSFKLEFRLVKQG